PAGRGEPESGSPTETYLPESSIWRNPSMRATKQASEPNRGRAVLPLALALAALVIGAGRSQATGLEKLRPGMRKDAEGVSAWLKERPEKGVVAMSSFQNLPELATNPSPGLTLMLTEELTRARAPLKIASALGIRGTLFRFPEEGPLDKITEMTIALDIVGPGNKVVDQKNLKVKDRETIDLLTGRDA